ncbi:MAG: hypothetical protein FWC17_01355 [Treponema sp.]|nr:hypothetical protein [Treponema sp.]
MKRKLLIIIFFISALCAKSYAAGGSETQSAAAVTRNNSWILCVTSFDTSSLSAEKSTISAAITREIVKRLSSIDYRTRISPEYAYYEDYAWAKDRSAAASALAAKIEERSALLYRGDTDWRYRQNAARIDAEIEALRKKLDDVENNVPLINSEPVFGLSRANHDDIFPDAPLPGSEYAFCASQGSDAFLTGSIMDFYGRYFLSVKLYAVFNKAYIWEDAVIFSNEDMQEALTDLARKLMIALSGNAHAQVTVRAQPQDTLILINGSFAGRGETAQTDYPPGSIIVSASAPDHASVTYETELLPGENVDVNINLHAFEYGNIDIFGKTQGSIYHGALYLGESPLTIRLPSGSMEYLELITLDSGRAAFALNTPAGANFSYPVTMNAVLPIESGRLEKDRSAFYWAFGGTWIAGIAAWISYYTFAGADAVISNNYYRTGRIDQGLYDSSRLMQNIYIGSVIAAGAAAVYGIYRLVMYLYTSSRDVTPVITAGKN